MTHRGPFQPQTFCDSVRGGSGCRQALRSGMPRWGPSAAAEVGPAALAQTSSHSCLAMKRCASRWSRRRARTPPALSPGPREEQFCCSRSVADTQGTGVLRPQRILLGGCVPTPQVYPVKDRLEAAEVPPLHWAFTMNRGNIDPNTSSAGGIVWTIRCELQPCVSSAWHGLAWPFGYSPAKSSDRQPSSPGRRLETDFVGAPAQGNVRTSEWGGLSTGLRASRLRVRSSFPKAAEHCLRSPACCFLTDARTPSASKMRDRQQKVRGASQAAPSAATRLPAGALPADGSATGGLPVNL